jgi:hypothetical protein
MVAGEIDSLRDHLLRQHHVMGQGRSHFLDCIRLLHLLSVEIRPPAHLQQEQERVTEPAVELALILASLFHSPSPSFFCAKSEVNAIPGYAMLYIHIIYVHKNFHRIEFFAPVWTRW